MKFLTISKFFLVLALPFLIFLLVLNFGAFDKSFYQKKFLEYGVKQNIPEAISLHEKVVNFIKGKDNSLPSEFNAKEKKHLWDVRNLIKALTILLYILIILFLGLLAVSAFTLKINNYIADFVGNVLVFGGFLTIALAAILFFLISSDFSAAFESFHRVFFDKGTYSFDPAKEIIVNLYPEELFMDLGIRLSKGVVIISMAAVLFGMFLLFKSKSKRIKR